MEVSFQSLSHRVAPFRRLTSGSSWRVFPTGIFQECSPAGLRSYYNPVMIDPPAGFRELEHTADWQLEVWAPDLPTLLEYAARGMYALSETRFASSPTQARQIELSGPDEESLLVGFLSELLFLAEQEGIGFEQYNLQIEAGRLIANLGGTRILSQSKEIKAVTYHDLEVRRTERGLEARIVFDV